MQKRILIVEDEGSMLNALRDKFSRENFEVLEAKNGEQGLRLALHERPDIILLDLVMPVMDGITMLTHVREDTWGQAVPVIILTNLNDNEKLAEAMAHGSYDYLVKSDHKIEDIVMVVKKKLGLAKNG